MDSKLMNFDQWSLNESTKQKSNKMLDVIAGALGDTFGKVHVVPNFEKFGREGEPRQNSILVGTESGASFGINFAGSEFYSVDVWDKDSIEPAKTVYADGHSVEEVLRGISSAKTNEAGETRENPLVLYVDGDPEKDELVVKDEPKWKTEFSQMAAEPAVVPAVSVDPAKKDPEMKAEYDYQDPDTIFTDLESYTDMVVDGTQPAMLITGMAGVGKTFTVTKQIKKAGLVKDKDFYHVKGKSTAAGMYQTLYEQNGKLIIFDDMDSIFDDKNAVNILKGALDSEEVREIAWITNKPLKTQDGATIPQRFDFTGRVIFISNLPQRSIDDAIKSRSFVVEVALSPTDMIKYIEGLFDNIMPYERVSLKRYALDAIKAAAANNPKVQINIRTFIKAFKIVKHVPDKTMADRMLVQQCSYK